MAINLTANCRLFLKLNEAAWAGGADVTDDSPLGNDATAYGALAPIAGKIGNCATFEVGKHIIVPEVLDSLSFGETTDFSIVFWFKIPLAQSVTELLLSKQVYQDQGYNFMIRNDNKVSFGLSETSISNSAISDLTYNDNTWHHAIGTFDRDGLLNLYIDGVIAEATPPSISAITVIDNDENLYLGRRSREVDPLPSTASLDALMIFDKLLSTDEIAFLYNSGMGVEVLTDAAPGGDSELSYNRGGARGIALGINRGVF
ncbi:MAG: LamG domain-containing protein [Firmicutes bacterium]|nr:LamG domain-containing protein [Bacillota bacterium]